MTATYCKHGVVFLYPENWALEEQEGHQQWTASVQSPKTAFWSITVDRSGKTPETMAAEALQTLRDEYSMLDATETRARVGDWDTVGYDVAFFCMDLTNSAGIRAFRSDSQCVLLLFQATDAEWEAFEPVFRALSHSVQWNQ